MQKRFVCSLNRHHLSRSLPFVPLAAAAIGALSSGCGSGHGTSYINPPLVQTPVVLPSGTVTTPTPIPSGMPTPIASPTPTTGTIIVPTPAPSPVAPNFTATALGDYNGNFASVFRINDAGQVLASAQNFSSSISPILLYANGAYQAVTAPMSAVIPSDINTEGTIVGYYSPTHTGTDYRPFIVDGGGFRELDIYKGSFTAATAINTNGQIVGYSFRDNVTQLGSPSLGFLYDNGTVTDLGYLSGATPTATSSTNPTDINDAGQVVGSSTTASGKTHAFLWQNGTMRDLGALNSGDSSSAAALNNKGQAVGSSTPAGDTYGNNARAVLFDNGTVQALDFKIDGVAPEKSYANDINDSGQIVGTFYTAEHDAGGIRAFFYDHGVVVDLSAFLPPNNGDVLVQYINNKGQIVVTTVVPGFYNPFLGSPGTSYLLTPVTKAARVVGFTVSAKPASVGNASKKH